MFYLSDRIPFGSGRKTDNPGACSVKGADHVLWRAHDLAECARQSTLAIVYSF
jgi:hypothetical protein